MRRIEDVLEIEAPVEKVFAYYADMGSMDEMWPGSRWEKASEGPIDVGTIYRYSVPFGGRRVEGEVEFVVYEENRRVKQRQTKGISRGSIPNRPSSSLTEVQGSPMPGITSFHTGCWAR